MIWGEYFLFDFSFLIYIKWKRIFLLVFSCHITYDMFKFIVFNPWCFPPMWFSRILADCSNLMIYFGSIFLTFYLILCIFILWRNFASYLIFILLSLSFSPTLVSLLSFRSLLNIYYLITINFILFFISFLYIYKHFCVVLY